MIALNRYWFISESAKVQKSFQLTVRDIIIFISSRDSGSVFATHTIILNSLRVDSLLSLSRSTSTVITTVRRRHCNPHHTSLSMQNSPSILAGISLSFCFGH
ncbi:hypothetical protein VNO77_33491 [Canavalia gladiata]|uniref:Uncharacterized protein n=1 Tax=Canavalia gladiata TaxID=3824 RepID=A0AAN9PYY9_CANGL